MKTIPMVPACQNMEELHKLTDLICYHGGKTDADG